MVDDEIRKKFGKDDKIVRGYFFNYMVNFMFDLFVNFNFVKVILDCMVLMMLVKESIW